MDIKVGCDIVDVNRFKGKDKEFLNKIFHPTELKSLKAQTLAGIFAAKESCKKVFNDLHWHDIEVVKKKSGKPVLVLDKENIKSHDLSISHDGEYAIATVAFIIKNGK